MLKHLNYDEDEKMDITLAIIQFFKDVDVNGDGGLDWVEFCNYIIEISGNFNLYILN